MKTLATNFNENKFNGFEILSENEMLEVRGGIQPVTRDRDVIDLGEE
ncbi:MAG: hypothetical protein J7L95_08470 [Prolixibacteraceae bacterium]|nr:hypothetical protein [Prolixibacteraceae bacterium]